MFVAGFSTTLNSAVTKSIIKTMEMNGSLESGFAGVKAKEGGESEEEDDDDEEEKETASKGITVQRFGGHLITNPGFDLFGFVVAASSQPKKKEASRKHRTTLPNGKVTGSDSHRSNGCHSRSTLNGEDSQEAGPLSNGHLAGEESGARDLDSGLPSASAGTRFLVYCS